MSAASALGVKGVDGPALEGGDGIFDETALVQRVGVDGNLHIQVVRDREATIDGGRGRTPVFVELQAASASLDLLNKTRRQAGIAFAEKTEIHGKGVSGLQHPPNVPGARRT